MKESARTVGVAKLAAHKLSRYAESQTMPNQSSVVVLTTQARCVQADTLMMAECAGSGLLRQRIIFQRDWRIAGMSFELFRNCLIMRTGGKLKA